MGKATYNFNLQDIAPVAPPEPRRGGGFLSGFLPMVTGGIGATVGALGGPLGIAAGGAAGSALGEFLRQRITGEADDGIDKGNLVEEGILGAVPGLFKAGTTGLKSAKAGGSFLKGAAGLDEISDTAGAFRKGGKLSQALIERGSGLNPTDVVGDTARMQQRASFMSRYKGTPAKQRSLMDADMSRLGQEVDKVLEVTPVKMSGRSAMKNFEEAVKNGDDIVADLDLSSPATVKRVNEFLSKYQNLTNAKQVNDQLKTAQKVARAADDALRTKGNLTSVQTARLVEKRIVDKMLSEIDEIKPLKQQMAQIYENYPDVTKATQKTWRLPLINTDVKAPTQVVKGIESYAGGALAGVPNTGIGGNVARQAGARAAGSAFIGTPFVQQQEAPQDPLGEDPMAGSDDLYAEAGITPDEQIATSSPFGDPAQVQQAYYNALNSGDLKSAEAILKGFETFGGAEGGTAASTNNAAKASSALRVLDVLERRFKEAGGGQGRISGTTSKLAGKLGLNDAANVYEAQRTSYLSQISRALGEVGVLTDKDIDRIASALPSMSSNPEEAQAWFDDLRQLLMQTSKSTMQTNYMPEDMYSSQVGL